jgi:hypothetical protein
VPKKGRYRTLNRIAYPRFAFSAHERDPGPAEAIHANRGILLPPYRFAGPESSRFLQIEELDTPPKIQPKSRT